MDIQEKSISDSLLGTWHYLERNIIINNDLISQYQSNYDSVYNDVMLHEWCHVFQPDFEYSFLNEALAEMISNEFSNSSYSLKPVYEIDSDGNRLCSGVLRETNIAHNSYLEEQRYTKILIEIIGPEPLVKFNYTGNTEAIKNELEPYLEESDIKKLFKLFRYSDAYVVNDLISQEKYDDNINQIKVILSKLYENKYDESVEENNMIQRLLTDDDFANKKFYFNKNILINDISDNYLISAYKLFKNNDSFDYKCVEVSVENRNGYCQKLKDLFLQNANLKNREKKLLYNEELFDDFIKYKTKQYNSLCGSDTIYESDYINFFYNVYIYPIEDSSTSIIAKNNPSNYRITINKTNCCNYASENNLTYNEVYEKEILEQFIKNFCGDYSQNNILCNACNNIILKEYYGIDSYESDRYTTLEEKTTKILMDIIGNEPLKYYYFTGDDILIREKLEPYLGTSLEQVMVILKSKIEAPNASLDYNLNFVLCYLYNKVNGTNYEPNDFIDQYNIPDNKGYFSDSYIERNKQNYFEYYNSDLMSNDIGKNIK